MRNLDSLILELNNIHGSEFMKMPFDQIQYIQNKFSDMPDDLFYLYTKLGYGCVGSSRYMIHALIDPDEIYDSQIAKALDGCLIVGEDFSGNCEAYKAKNGWVFGVVDCNGQFTSYSPNYKSIVEFLYDWFVEAEPNKL